MEEDPPITPNVQVELPDGTVETVQLVAGLSALVGVESDAQWYPMTDLKVVDR